MPPVLTNSSAPGPSTSFTQQPAKGFMDRESRGPAQQTVLRFQSDVAKRTCAPTTARVAAPASFGQPAVFPIAALVSELTTSLTSEVANAVNQSNLPERIGTAGGNQHSEVIEAVHWRCQHCTFTSKTQGGVSLHRSACHPAEARQRRIHNVGNQLNPSR